MNKIQLDLSQFGFWFECVGFLSFFQLENGIGRILTKSKSTQECDVKLERVLIALEHVSYIVSLVDKKVLENMNSKLLSDQY